MRVHRQSFFTACAVMMSLCGSALADGVVRDGVGAVSIGRGGTNIANADNGAVILDNPAGMVNLEGSGIFEIAIDGLITDLDYSDPQNSTNAKFRPMALPELSYVRKSSDGQFAYGLGMFIPAGFGAEWDMRQPPFSRTPGYKSIGALAKILPGLAYRIDDRLSVGGTFGVAVTHAELEGPFFLQSGPLAGAPTLLDLQATGAAPTWSLGLQYQLNDSTTLGLTYIDETRFRLEGSANARVFVAPPPAPLLSSNFDADVDLVWPRSVGLGVKHDFCEHQRVSVDLIWFDWSHAFEEVGLKLKSPSNPAFDPVTPYRDRFPLNWDDSVSLRLGYEYFVNPCEVLRAGYLYNSSNVPSSTLTPYIPAILEHTFSVGYGRRFTTWTVDAAYQFAFSPERHVNNSSLLGDDFDNSSVKAQAHWLSFSFSRRF
jgi:long-subunit fatty acid transport protein